jgi:hypothetical protein
MALMTLEQVKQLVNENYAVKWEELPFLTLDYQGDTGYLDFLKAEDLPAEVVRGEDPHGRPFVALRLKSQESGKEHVLCFFQRYTDDPRLWVFGGVDIVNSSYKELDIVESFLKGDQVPSYRGPLSLA